MMRKLILVLLATAIGSTMPIVAQPVEAKSLFESLFPRAAERRRAREERARARQQRLRPQNNTYKTRVRGPVYKTYVAEGPRSINFGKLSKALVAQDKTRKKAQSDKLKILITNRSYSLDSASSALVASSSAQELLDWPDEVAGLNMQTSRDVGNAVVSFYAKSSKLHWIKDNQPTANAQKIVSIMSDASTFGLDPEHYRVPQLTLSDGRFANENDALTFEFGLSSALLQYARDASHGLVNPNRISGYHDFAKPAAMDGTLIATLSANSDPVTAMVDLHPNDAAFFALKDELAVQRAKALQSNAITIRDGTFLKPGQSSDQLELIVEIIRRKGDSNIRSDHFDTLAVDHSDGLYSDDVVALVKDFQRQVSLRPDGIIGRNTIARMSSESPQKRIDQVLYAMERLRWHPDRFGQTHVFINQPAYRATYMRNGKAELSMRAIVGKPANQTSFFHDTIEYVEFNPYWGVPRSILVNEMLPKLRANPGYLDNLGYEVTTVSGRRISSSNVDWYGVGSDFPFNVRQPPGVKNALGELKIMFPNKHSIYMHDTPARSLFKRQKRALSHGCVRLAEPRRMAAAVLGTNVNAVSGQVNQGQNRKQDLKVKIPVYVAYFTAWPDGDGTVHYFSDIYGRDKALSKAVAAEHKVRFPNT